MLTLTVTGTIIRQSNHKPIAKLYVEMWDKDASHKEKISSTITDVKGAFTFNLVKSHISELYKDKLPDVYFKVFAGRILVASTENTVTVNLAGNIQDILIPVNYVPERTGPPSNPAQPYSVKGRILKNDFTPANDHAIEVCDKGIVRDITLASARTDARGNFETSFSGDTFSKTGKESPDVFLKISSGDQVVLETDVRYNAPTVLEYHEVIGGGEFPVESEFEVIEKRIQPLLQDTRATEIQQTDRNNPYRLLAEKTGKNEQQVKYYVIAHQLSLFNKIPAAFYYALLRGQLVSDHAVSAAAFVGKDISQAIDFLVTLQDEKNPFINLSQQPENIIRTLALLPETAVPAAFDFAIHNNIIPAQLRSQREVLLKQWSSATEKFHQAPSDEATNPANQRPRLTATFAGKLSANKDTAFNAKDTLSKFFNAYPDLELHETNLDLFFQKNNAGIGKQFADQKTLKTELKRIQRVFRLAPEYEKAKALLDNNFHSSQSIFNAGKQQFVKRMSGSMAEEEALKIYNKAERSYAATLAIVGEMKSLEHGSAFKVLPNVFDSYDKKVAMKDFPDWKTLFSSPDICDCSDCRNVYSPAAYLADLLKFLTRRGAKATLFKRRPDIGEIDLNCSNSNTPIQYVDLVCEILEDTLLHTPVIVSSGIEPLLTEGLIDAGVVTEFNSKNLDIAKDAAVTLGTATTWFLRDTLHTYKINKAAGQLQVFLIKQTHGSAAERKAMPEYINYNVYDSILKNQKHPFELPFDLSWEETRAYLTKIGVDRAEWMKKFRNKVTLTPTDIEIASEYIGISPTERNMICVADPGGQAGFWGGLVNIDTVSVFLQKSGLEYTQLLDLLKVKFINPSLDSKIIHHDTVCDTGTKTISNVDNNKLDRINRFLRLWRKTGWKFRELDAVLMNPKIGNGQLDLNFLVSLQAFMQLRISLNLSVEQVLAWYEDLNFELSTSLYNKLFRNKVTLDPLPDAFKTEFVTGLFPDPVPPAPDGSDRTITGQLKSISAVLKLKTGEAETIQTNSLANDHLDLANLSLFYRIASLTRKLRITAREYYWLLEILNTGNVFEVFKSPAETNEFISLVTLIRSTGFKISELQYLLLHKDVGTRPLIPTDINIGAFITKGRNALQKIKDELDEINGVPDEISKTLVGKLSFENDSIPNNTTPVFNGSFAGSTADRDIYIDAVYSPFIDTASIKTKLNDRDAAPDADKDQKTNESWSELNSKLITYLKTESGKQAVYTLHAEEFGFPADISKLLLTEAHLPAVTDKLISYWLDEALLAKDVNGHYINDTTAANFPKLFNSYLLLSKIAMLQAKLPFNADNIALLIKHAGDFAVLAFDELPVSAAPADSHFEKWKNYALLNQFSKTYPDNDTGTLNNVLGKLVPAPATETEFLQSLADYTLWDITELTRLKAQLGLNYPAHYMRPQTWLDLDTCFNLLATPAMKASEIPVAIVTTPVAINAIAVKQLVKSKYEEAQWLDTSANLQEGIRAKKRDALIAYFTHNVVAGNKFEDADALYSYYLLDTEMGAKEITTRILQANLSIQLFVQRCLMNLEADVTADADADSGWKQWNWMKYFQVWVANRKVFLYPENWIEPELRLDKSQFFEELESDLMQNEVTKANVENAYMGYLEKLDNVARLDVTGFFYEEETYTLHVFARTYDDPNIYYYRKWVEDRYWTAWEKMEIEIHTTHVIPVVINRRLYLYWPEFREKSVQPSSTAVPDINMSSFDMDLPYKYWEIHLAVSEYRNNKWTPKKISKTAILSPNKYGTQDLYGLFAQENFSFVPIDLLDICDRYLIGCYFNNTPDDPNNFYNLPVDFFDLGSCHGTPEILDDPNVKNLVYTPILPQFERSELKFLESHESTSQPNDALAYHQGNVFLNHIPILLSTPGRFRTPQPAQLSFFDKLWLKLVWAYLQTHKGIRDPRIPHPIGSMLPFFYEDKQRTFFVPSEIILYKRNRKKEEPPMMGEFFYSDIIKIIQEIIRTHQLPDILKPYFEDGQWPQVAYKLKFSNFYHPYVCFLIKQLYMHGIDGIMKREVQMLDKTVFPEIKSFDFGVTYQPTGVVNPIDTRVVPNPMDPDTTNHPGYPKETMDFNAWGSYAQYNWELFYHGPMLIAERLKNNQQFEDAMHWYHYIFNPTDASALPSPQRFWNTKPFFIRSNADYINQRIDQILNMINNGDTELIKDVDDWRNNPFEPHLIAQFRTVAYQKTTVMKYLDNLIAWGDNLFRTDTRENITAATQLYILAAEILGRKPKIIPNFFEAPVLNYNQLEPKLDAFSNAMIEVENFLPYFSNDIEDFDPGVPLPSIDIFYFCIPPNDKMLTYWDTISDRLFKIRNSMNIEGIERQLALFDPPIDPAMLVRAVASGLSISQAIAGLNSPLPLYRFQVLVQKANEFCGEVKALGQALLSALEKKDAEAMALLRSSHEIELQKATKKLRQFQLEEANANIEVLNKTKAITNEKLSYYSGMSYMNPAEITAFALSIGSTAIDAAIAVGHVLAGGLKAIPKFVSGGAGFGGSPTVHIGIGGDQIGDAAEIAVHTLNAIASALDKGAALASTQGTYQRRQDDWDFQARSANKELDQIDQQLAVADIRVTIAQQDLDNVQLQIDNAKEADQFMRDKYTNQQLYEWMITQISGLYFQSYQLALDMAKKAEKCYRYELGLTDSGFIQPGYWDSLKKGLLSGEKLSLDLKRLEASYFDKNKRELEITKHISLNQIDPLALLTLKQTGVCFFNLPEELYDLDYPGHYFRRIKSAAITVPCIVGPYSGVNCTLSILKSRIRTTANAAMVDYSTAPTEEDAGFTFNFSSIQQIVTSSAQMDNGMFENNLRDERYLPFEGHGAISEWKLELNNTFKNFDPNTVSDVILHVRYTARQGGGVLATKVKSELNNHFDQIIKTTQNGTGFFKMFSMKTDFPTEFYQLMHPSGGTQQTTFAIIPTHVPYWLSGKNLEIDDTTNVLVYLKLKAGQTINVNTLSMQFNGQAVSFAPAVNLGELKVGTTPQSGPLFGNVNINAGASGLDAGKIDDVMVLVKYLIV